MRESEPGLGSVTNSPVRKWVGIAFGLALLAWLLSQADLSNMKNMLAQADLKWLSMGCAAYLVSSLFRAYRFVLLTQSPPGRISNMTVVVLAMSLANQILPARLGELSYVYLARRTQGLAVGSGLVSLLIARLFDLMAIGLLYLLVTLPLLDQFPSETLIYIWATVGSMALVVVIIAALAIWRIPVCQSIVRLLKSPVLARLPSRPKLMRLVRNTEASLGMMRSARQLGSLLLASLAIWLSAFGMQFLALRSLNVPVTFRHTIIGATFAALTSILPVNSIGSFGTLEAGWTAGFVLIGMDANVALTTGFAIHLLILAYPIMFGLPAWGWVTWVDRKTATGGTEEGCSPSSMDR